MWLGKGLLFGFGISLLIGPIFFFMLEAGIKYGFKRALHFALGTWISDIIFIISTYLAFSKIQDLIKNPETLNTIKLSVGVILICIGIFSFLYNVKVKKQTSSKKIIASKLLTKGFFINTLNPNALLIWCGAATILLQFEIENKLSAVSIVLYYLGIQFMIILTDIFKLYLGHQIKSFLSEQHLFYIRFVSSSIFILFGIYLLL